MKKIEEILRKIRREGKGIFCVIFPGFEHFAG
jgi:hypothetical protein